MLEAYNAQFDSFNLSNHQSPAPRSSRSTGGFNGTSLLRGVSSDNLHCPQPFKPSSPLTRKKSRRTITTEDREREACQEIQQILNRSEQSTPVQTHAGLSWSGFATAIPVASPAYEPMLISEPLQETSSVPLDMYALAQLIDRPSANRNLFFNTPTLEDRHLMQSQSMDVNESASNVSMHHDDEEPGLRLVRNHSPRNSDAPMYGYEPAVTPPMRSANPITMNSPFCHGYGREGAEIGLLSFSPPSDLPSVLSERRGRITSSPNMNDYQNKKRFGDATTKHRPRTMGGAITVNAPSL